MNNYGKGDFLEVLKAIKKVRPDLAGKKVNIHYYDFGVCGRWHIQVRKGLPDGLGTGYDPGSGEWWTVEQWLKKPVDPVIMTKKF